MIYASFLVSYCAACQYWPIGQFWLVLYDQSNFIGFQDTPSYWSVQFFISHLPERTETGLITGLDQIDAITGSVVHSV